MTTYRLMDGASGRPGVGSSGTQPPSSPTGYSGDFLAGVNFSVTGQVMWFEGFWWWCPTGGDTGAQKFALWNMYGTSSQSVVAGTVVTSGTLTAGAWNYVPIVSPVQLAPGALYVAATGWSAVSGFPDTGSQFGSGNPYAGGITNGPLVAWSDPTSGGTKDYPNFFAPPQGLFSVAGTDPSVNMPNGGSSASNFWIDVQVSDTAPPGYSGSYRLWPNMGDLNNYAPDTANNFTLGMEFTLAQACTLNNVWFYSPATVTQLPTEVAIYSVSGGSIVSGTHVTSPSWKLPGGSSASAGGGWMYVAVPGSVSLPSGDYKATVFNGAGSPAVWNAALANYWSTGFGGSGLAAGPIAAPNNASATSPGQDTYHQGTPITYPLTNAGPYNYGVDVEVTPASGTPHTATASLSVTPSLSAARGRGKNRTGALSVSPVLDALRRRGRFRTGTRTVTPVFAATGQKAGAARTASASLTVTPSFAAGRRRGRNRAAALTVTPSLSAGRARGKFRSALLAVTAAFTAAGGRGRFRSASLPVSPVLHATAGHGTGNAHTASASLTVAPVLAASRSHGHARVSHLTVSPAFVTGRTVAHTRMGALVIHPSMGAVVSGGSAPAATFQTGSWWGLDTVLKQSRQEFDAYRSAPPLACPDDGEPLMNAPATNAGSGKELYCKYCGWSFPRDWLAPSRPGW